MLSLKDASKGFSAVGSEPRLSVLLTLVKVGPKGLTIGEIQKELDIPASTLAHHLRLLEASNLIKQEKQGREVTCSANYQNVKTLADYLLHKCCSEI